MKNISNDSLSPRRWTPKKGRWIWTSTADGRANIFACFQHTFQIKRLSATSAGHTLHITGNSRYRIWLNGQYVGDGPPPTPCDWRYVDAYRVGPLLREGDNLITVTVHHIGNQPRSLGGLIAEIRDSRNQVVEASGSHWLAGGGNAWKAHTFAFGMNRFDPFQEHQDLRQLPTGWPHNPEAPEWCPAVLSNRTARLWCRDIPLLTRTPVATQKIIRVEEATALANRVRAEDLSIVLSMPGRPVEDSLICDASSLLSLSSPKPMTLDVFNSRDSRQEPAIVLDFGKIVRGCVEIDVTTVDGARVDVGFAEQLIDGWFNNSLEGQFAASATFRGGRQTWRTFSWRGFRYLKLRLMNKGPLQIHRLAVMDEHQPAPRIATFSSSDPLLNNIFTICRDTLELGRHEILMDTPWREQGQWLGDNALVVASGIRWCFGDTATSGKFFREAAWSQRKDGLLDNLSDVTITSGLISHAIPDYSLLWIEGLWEHRRDLRDARWTRVFYPQIQRILDSFVPHLAADGLITNHPSWVLIDWAAIDRKGKCAALNALYARALRLGISFARELGRYRDAERWELRLQKLASAFDERFWDARRNLYVDAWHRGKPSDTASEHTQVAALHAGLAKGPQIASLLSWIRPVTPPDLVEAQPFFCALLLRVLAREGRFDTALDLIRERWGKRFVAKGYTTTPEEWSSHGTWRHGDFLGILRSRSHAWSAFPAEFFLRILPDLKSLPQAGETPEVDRPLPALDYEIHLPGGEQDVVIRNEKSKRRTRPTPLQKDRLVFST